MPRNQRRKEDRPDEIVAAAFTEFADRGYADTKLDRVAKRAGVSKGLVFLYFKTKEQLFKAVVRAVVVPRIDAFEAAIAAHEGSLASFLRGPFVEFAAALPESPARHVVRLIVAEGPKHPDLTRWYHDNVISRVTAALAGLFQRAEDSGEIKAATLSQQPLLLIGPVVIGMIWKLLFDSHKPLDTRAFLNAHVDMMLGAFAISRSDA
ncbi:MAG: TetR/AcrR family transcriptional regulator [Pseudomonadota bacterium]